MGVIKAGDILHIFAKDTNPPKEKFVVILGINDDKVEVLTVFINSKINTNVYKTKFQQDLNYLIKSSDYAFLKYDSYIDLNKTFERDKNSLEWLLKNRPEAYITRLREEHLNDCQNLIRNNGIIKGKKCKQFGFFD